MWNFYGDVVFGFKFCFFLLVIFKVLVGDLWVIGGYVGFVVDMVDVDVGGIYICWLNKFLFICWMLVDCGV